MKNALGDVESNSNLIQGSWGKLDYNMTLSKYLSGAMLLYSEDHFRQRE